MDTPSIGITAIGYALPERVVDLATLHEGGLLDSPVDVLAEFGFRCIQHVGEEFGLHAARGFELDILFLKRPFHTFAVGDIANRAADECLVFGLERTEADLDRKFFAVLTKTE